MSYPAPILGELQTGDGPPPHEDLTIAEQLQTMRVHGEDRPGKQCFVSANGAHRWIGDQVVQRFVTNHGADHSPDYLNSHGIDWQMDFFSGN